MAKRLNSIKPQIFENGVVIEGGRHYGYHRAEEKGETDKLKNNVDQFAVADKSSGNSCHCRLAARFLTLGKKPAAAASNP